MGITALVQRVMTCLFPVPLQRTPGQQAAVDRQCAGLSLYQYRSCPYCARVRRAIDHLALNIEMRNVHREPRFRDQLLQGGGRFQVPCLRIEQENGEDEWLYESADIIAYLRGRFADIRQDSLPPRR